MPSPAGARSGELRPRSAASERSAILTTSEGAVRWHAGRLSARRRAHRSSRAVPRAPEPAPAVAGQLPMRTSCSCGSVLEGAPRVGGPPRAPVRSVRVSGDGATLATGRHRMVPTCRSFLCLAALLAVRHLRLIRLVLPLVVLILRVLVVVVVVVTRL